MRGHATPVTVRMLLSHTSGLVRGLARDDPHHTPAEVRRCTHVQCGRMLSTTHASLPCLLRLCTQYMWRGMAWLSIRVAGEGAEVQRALLNVDMKGTPAMPACPLQRSKGHTRIVACKVHPMHPLMMPLLQAPLLASPGGP